MSAVLSPWFSVVLLLLCGSSEGLKIITAEPGENVTLTCKDEKNDDSLIVLEWTREDLETKNVFVFRDGRPFPSGQHESYENRVFLKDSQMKNGNLSVVLENVMINDSGTYECKVRHENDPQKKPKLISSIRLSVVPPGNQGGRVGDKEGKNEDGGREEEGLSTGGIIGTALAVLAVVVVVLVGFWIYWKKKGPNQRRLNIV